MRPARLPDFNNCLRFFKPLFKSGASDRKKRRQKFRKFLPIKSPIQAKQRALKYNINVRRYMPPYSATFHRNAHRIFKDKLSISESLARSKILPALNSKIYIIKGRLGIAPNKAIIFKHIRSPSCRLIFGWIFNKFSHLKFQYPIAFLFIKYLYHRIIF